jgi:hypothetical protein
MGNTFNPNYYATKFNFLNKNTCYSSKEKLNEERNYVINGTVMNAGVFFAVSVISFIKKQKITSGIMMICTIKQIHDTWRIDDAGKHHTYIITESEFEDMLEHYDNL